MKKKLPAIKSDLERAATIPGVPDEESPEITDEELDRAVFSIGGVVLPTPRRPGRPAGSGKKAQTTVRFDREVLSGFRALGRGWQTRMNGVLRDWLKAHPARRGKAVRSSRSA